jgi:O-antigen ligase
VALFPVLLAAPSIYWNRLGLTFVNARLLADSQPVGGESAAGPSALPVPSPNAAGPASASAPTPPQAAAPAAAPATAAAPQPTPAAATPLSALDRAHPSDSIFTRVGVLNVTFEVFRLHPLTGVGKENFHQAYSQNVQRVDPTLPVGPLSPHNTPLHVAAETGLLGLSCFVAILVLTVLGLRQSRRLAVGRGLAQEASLLQAMELSIYGYLVASLFLSDTIYQRYLWLLVALAAAGRQIVLERGAAGAD